MNFVIKKYIQKFIVLNFNVSINTCYILHSKIRFIAFDHNIDFLIKYILILHTIYEEYITVSLIYNDTVLDNEFIIQDYFKEMQDSEINIILIVKSNEIDNKFINNICFHTISGRIFMIPYNINKSIYDLKCHLLKMMSGIEMKIYNSTPHDIILHKKNLTHDIIDNIIDNITFDSSLNSFTNIDITLSTNTCFLPLYGDTHFSKTLLQFSIIVNNYLTPELKRVLNFNLDDLELLQEYFSKSSFFSKNEDLEDEYYVLYYPKKIITFYDLIKKIYMYFGLKYYYYDDLLFYDQKLLQYNQNINDILSIPTLLPYKELTFYILPLKEVYFIKIPTGKIYTFNLKKIRTISDLKNILIAEMKNDKIKTLKESNLRILFCGIELKNDYDFTYSIKYRDNHENEQKIFPMNSSLFYCNWIY